jgi:phosphonate transport system substrate-binding protein
VTAVRITTIQSLNQDIVIQDIAAYLARALEIETEFVIDMPWQEREPLLDAGDVQIAWICGLPYVWKADIGRRALELLAAPGMRAERYLDRPIYFSDVIEKRGSRYQSFEDLRGARRADNEPRSHSGHNIAPATLAAMGARRGFFEVTIESGSHLRSIEMVRDGSVDASDILRRTISGWTSMLPGCAMVAIA